LHGANRLASNSLSECFVFGRRAARAAISEPAPDATEGPPSSPVRADPSEETRAALWEHAGLVRDAAGLERLAGDPHPLARLIGHAALARRESRGCQIRSDFADTDARFDERHLVIRRDSADAVERWS
jgi:L-aspartate oxidase